MFSTLCSHQTAAAFSPSIVLLLSDWLTLTDWNLMLRILSFIKILLKWFSCQRDNLRNSKTFPLHYHPNTWCWRCLNVIRHLWRINIRVRRKQVLPVCCFTLNITCRLSSDFLIRNPTLFKAKKTSDPDTPSINEALSGKHRDDFIEAMRNEINELKKY